MSGLITLQHFFGGEIIAPLLDRRGGRLERSDRLPGWWTLLKTKFRK